MGDKATARTMADEAKVPTVPGTGLVDDVEDAVKAGDLSAEEVVEAHIARIEQLYPFPRDDFKAVADRYPNAQLFVWCQEEPQNQGAWDQVKHRFHALHNGKRELIYAGIAHPTGELGLVSGGEFLGIMARAEEYLRKVVDEGLGALCDALSGETLSGERGRGLLSGAESARASGTDP